MAIYHLNAKIISRGKGQSATAAAAYRAGEKITDIRTGLTFDYSRRHGVYATEILAPDRAPDWVSDRSLLWNEVELFETRKNSRLAREFDIALPVELSHSQKRELVRDFVITQFINHGLVADVAFHDINSHNPHVHIMLTTRRIDEQGFGAKDRDLDRKDFLIKLRESWSAQANRALERAGVSERIDHRTLEEQGINRIPQIHLGPQVAAMRERGKPTERGETYQAIEDANQQIQALERQLTALEKKIERHEDSQRAAGDKEGDRLTTQEIDSSVQVAHSTTNSPLESELTLTQKKPIDQPRSDDSNEPERTNTAAPTVGEQLDTITERFGDASQRAGKLAERLRKPSRSARENRHNAPELSPERNNPTANESGSNREPEDLRNRSTDPSSTASALTREFHQLEERLKSSDRKTRKTRSSANPGLGAIAAELSEKIQQFVQSISGHPEDSEPSTLRDSQLDGGGVDHQTPRTAQRNLDNPVVHESGHLGTQPSQPPQQQPITRNQGQSQQYRNPPQPYREEVRQVKPTQPAERGDRGDKGDKGDKVATSSSLSSLSSPSSLSSQPQPKPQPLTASEVNQIVLTALETLRRYGKEFNEKTTFNNSHYQIQKFSVFETYGYRSYLTIEAKDGRGRLLTLKGQNFHPANLKIQESRLSRQDVNKLGEIQSALDYLQQVRQLFEDAKAILLRYGERDKNQPYKGYGTLEGKKYQIAFDSQSLRIVAKDGRGEIFNYPNHSDTRYPEAQAQANLTIEEFKFFRDLAQAIEDKRLEAQLQRQREQNLKRQRDRGFER